MSGIPGGDRTALDEQRLHRLIEVSRSLVSELDLEAVLRRLLEAARELTGARYAALGILNPERTELERFLTLGVDERARASIGELPRGRGVLGLLISQPKPLRLREVGDHPRSYGFPPGHPPMSSFLGVPILIRGEAFGNLYLTDKQGEAEFTEADEEAGVVLAEWAAIAIDNARLYQSGERQREELERAVHRLEAMTEISRVVGGETDLDRILSTVVKRGRALVSAKWLAILLPEDDQLVVSAIAGELEAQRRGMRIPIEDSLPGAVLRSMEAERFSGLAERKATRGDVWFEAEAELLVPMALSRHRRSASWSPAITWAIGPEFSAEDERLLAAFGASAATAVATARSVAEDRLRHSISAAERERGRWARELHDETLQGLGALRVLLASGLRGSSEALEGAVREATSQLDSEIQNLRALIAELRPAALDEIGVEAAIQGLAERVSATAGLAVDTELSLSGARNAHGPGSELESTIYRLVQEALTNVAKHSRAEHVRLSVIEHNGAVEVSVEDDGVGFDVGAGHGGFGLPGMRERVAMVGGSFELSSAPGAGATMRAVIPVPR